MLAPGLASASTASPRIDLNALVIGSDATSDVDYVAWQAALKREAVPVEPIVVTEHPYHLIDVVHGASASDGYGHVRIRSDSGQPSRRW